MSIRWSVKNNLNILIVFIWSLYAILFGVDSRWSVKTDFNFPDFKKFLWNIFHHMILRTGNSFLF